ncbi:efflux RND transporter periplasmic adaptor subunit [Marinobacteraceae bacterium S3BR75-40.1]
MKTATRFIIVIVVLGLILGGIFGYKMYQFQQMQAKFSQPQPPAKVEATRVEQSSWTPATKAVGSTRAVNGIAVANEVPGVVKELQFESGQQVEEGDVLVRLDAATDRAALNTRKAEAQLARQEFQRFTNLLPKKAVSQSQFDEAKANYEAAKARVVEAEAQLEKKVIRAPFSGIVGLRQVDLGEFLSVGRPIVEINMLDPMYVDYTLSEKELANVKVGDRVEVTVAAYPDQVFTGTVSAINSSVNAQSRTVQLRATLKNPESQLRPGMFANVSTIRDQQRELLTIPRTAISYNTYGDYVYLIAENDQGQLAAQRRSVKTGETRDGQVEILEGLKAGDRVVNAGLLRLRNGQPVEVQDKQEKDKQQSTAESEANAKGAAS